MIPYGLVSTYLSLVIFKVMTNGINLELVSTLDSLPGLQVDNYNMKFNVKNWNERLKKKGMISKMDKRF
jgi:hypothetical protein